jgi:hypothetical protein
MTIADRLKQKNLPASGQHHHGIFLFLLTLAVLLANAPMLTGLVNCDPESRYGGITTGWKSSLISAPACFVDPGPAYFTQPMGHLSALDWLHGIVPWWNPYSGVGMPLAAEMQNESFFLPFVFLLIFHSGWLIQKVIFQLLCGFLTYAFLTELRCSRLASFTGATLFALNGTFFLTAATAAAPLFCLPLLLLGIEYATRAAYNRQKMGWTLIALAVALSLYSGFPEIAYLDSLLGACWAAMRLTQTAGRARWRLLAKLCWGAGGGILLALPQLVPFLEYLKLANIGIHDGFTATSIWPFTATPIQIFPFFYGALGLQAPPGLEQSFGNLWVRIGGWFGMLPMLLALAALLAPLPQQRGVRLVLGLWAALWQGRCFGFPPLLKLFNLIPGMMSVDAPRYCGGAVEFAVFVLAALGLDALRRERLAPWHLALLLGLAACIVIAALVPVLSFMPAWYAAYPKAWIVGIGSTALSIIGALIWLSLLWRGKGMALTSAWLVGAAIVTMIVSQLGAPRAGTEMLDSVAALQSRIGLGRVYALGPFTGPYWTARRIATINYIQLPAPKPWSDYIHNHLYANADAVLFTGSGAGQLQAFTSNIPAYEQVGVQYLSLPAGTALPLSAARQMRMIAHDNALDIWELPHPAPYAEAPNCTVKLTSRQQMETDCTENSILLRRELFYPGWHARVNGRSSAITLANEIFQAVPLPAGHSQVDFFYRPTNIRAACALALTALALWLVGVLRARRL